MNIIDFFSATAMKKSRNHEKTHPSPRHLGEMIQHNCIGEMSAIPTAAPSAEETRLVVPGISPGTRAPKGRAGAQGPRGPGAEVEGLDAFGF